jgi:hypothetical protein
MRVPIKLEVTGISRPKPGVEVSTGLLTTERVSSDPVPVFVEKVAEHASSRIGAST